MLLSNLNIIASRGLLSIKLAICRWNNIRILILLIRGKLFRRLSSFWGRWCTIFLHNFYLVCRYYNFVAIYKPWGWYFTLLFISIHVSDIWSSMIRRNRGHSLCWNKSYIFHLNSLNNSSSLCCLIFWWLARISSFSIWHLCYCRNSLEVTRSWRLAT